MTLPTSRDLTAAPGGVVPSSLLNDLQDCTIGGKHGALVLNLGPASFYVDDPTTMTDTNGLTVGVAPSTLKQAVCDIDLPVGSVITEVKVICACTAATAGAITASWKKTTTTVGAAIATAAVASVVGAVGSAATANTLLAVTLTPGAPVTIAADEKHAILCVFSNSLGAKAIYRVQVSYNKP